ncbi:hypothetical protein BB558_002959, partial [Smittium angustum]
MAYGSDLENISQENFNKLINTFAAKKHREVSSSEKSEKSEKKQKINEESNEMDLDDVPLMERYNHISKNMTSEKTTQNSDFNPSYKMISKIVNKEKEILVSDKLKELQINLSLEELFGISPAIRKRFTDELRVRREPIVNLSTYEEERKLDIGKMRITGEEKEWNRFYLSAGSGKVKGYIMGAGVEFLLDEGSKINIMNLNVYNALKSLKRVEIDKNVKWSMRDANQGFSELIGVCKDCRITIEGIEVVVPVF